MSKLFINIPNNHFQIEPTVGDSHSFICTLKEFAKIEPSFSPSENMVEIEYNSEDGKRKCIKNIDDSIIDVSAELVSIFEGFIANVSNYASALKALRNPAPTLDEVKTRKINEVKSARDTFQYSDISYQNTTFSANETVQFQIISVLQGKQPTDPIVWFDINNQIMQWTAADLQGLKNAIEQRSNSAYGQYYVLAAMVNAYTSIDDVLDKKGNVTAKGVNGIEVKFL